jgi:dihydrofolate reductase
MRISLIAAMSENGVIGNNNALPWHLPEELKYFRKMTLGKPVIMGRKTFQSMGNKPLPNRQNIILTHDKDFLREDALVVHSVDEALKAAGHCEEVMIIGGASVYQAFLLFTTRLYLTVVHQEYTGDTFFPTINWKEWDRVSEEKMDGFTVKVWDKKGS